MPQHGGGPPGNSPSPDESPLVKEIEELAHLLFEWPIRQAPRLAFPFCIFVAAVLQGGIIILFSITYQPPSERLPSDPQIYFLPTDSPVARQIAPWLEANDPAVFSPQHATRAALPPPPPLSYRPSYEEPPPPLLPLQAEFFGSSGAVEPPPIPLMTGIVARHTPALKNDEAIPIPQAPANPRTVIRWEDDLVNRAITASVSGGGLPQAGSSVAKPALYEVGVSAEGLPMHCVLLDSSGDPVSDEAGSVWIHAQRFQPAMQESWGRVLILWDTSHRLMENGGHSTSQGANQSSTP